MKCIIFDLETTGLEQFLVRIVEISAYDLESGSLFHMRVKPDIPIPLESSHIHNIYDEDVKDCLSIGEILPKFVDFCMSESLGQRVCLIAHNNFNYDKFVLKSNAKRVGFKLPKFRYMDTLNIFREKYPYLGRHNLIYLKKYFNIEKGIDHSAKYDVLSLVGLYKILREDYSDEELYKISKNYILKNMPFGKYRGKSLATLPDSYVKWLNRNVLNDFSNRNIKKALQQMGRL